MIQRLCMTLMNEEVKATEIMEFIDRMGDSAFVNEGIIYTALTDYKNQLAPKVGMDVAQRVLRRSAQLLRLQSPD